jgi:hypothetical protein
MGERVCGRIPAHHATQPFCTALWASVKPPGLLAADDAVGGQIWQLPHPPLPTQPPSYPRSILVKLIAATA